MLQIGGVARILEQHDVFTSCRTCWISSTLSPSLPAKPIALRYYPWGLLLVMLLQNVTLGGTGKELGDRHPKVRAGAGRGGGRVKRWRRNRRQVERGLATGNRV